MHKLITNKYRKLFAFTLAEVLLTLLIIGIVSSIVIPNLISDTQDQEYKVAWKKAYSNINQSVIRFMADNGGNLKGICTDLDDNCLVNKFKVYFNYTKYCNRGETNGVCWSNKDLSLTKANSSIDSACAGLILSDGSFIIMRNEQISGCKFSGYRCGYMWVDVNGFKSPNIIGKDIFGLFIKENGISPWGTPPSDSYGCQGTSGGYAGAGCSVEYLYQ